MICTYRVTLEGIKGFYRVYKVNSNSSLYTFHKQLRSDLEFAMDQPILFKALDAEGNVIAKYALIDMGYGAVDTVHIADTIKAGAVKFIYFYDIASRKSVNITLEAQEAGETGLPSIVESKGPLPIEFENGYVAFEDLPEEHRKPRRPDDGENMDDDDDEDDDDDDSSDEDKEEEDIIYDENEAD